MSEKKKNALFYSREDLTGRGSSKIQLFELENPGEVNKINIDGKLVILNPVSVQETNRTVKPYVFIESYRNMDLTTVDVIYGNLNINELRKNEPLRKRLFDENLTRENLEIITRKYCGLIPYRVFNDPYGKKDFQMPKDKAPFLAKAIMGSAYVENRQTSINMNNARSSNSNYCIGLSGTNNGDDLKLKTKERIWNSDMKNFTVEEINLMCCFNTSSRKRLIDDMKSVTLNDMDGEIAELMYKTVRKLEAMTDAEFEELYIMPDGMVDD